MVIIYGILNFQCQLRIQIHPGSTAQDEVIHQHKPENYLDSFHHSYC